MVDVADVASPETTEPVDFEAFVAADVGSLTDGELVESLLVAQRMRARLDAAAIALVDRFDARTVWAADGDRSAAGWISARAGIAFGQAKSEARIARDLRRHDHITAAARAGRLTTAQVKALLGARRPGLEEAFDLCEELLVDGMTSFTLAAGHRFLARWAQSTRERLGINEPDGTEPEGGEGRSTVRLSPVGDRWAGDMDLSAEDGETVANAVAAQLDAMWRANVFTTDDGLTPSERRADALVELIRRGTRSGPDDGTATPLILTLTSAVNLARPPGESAPAQASPEAREPHEAPPPWPLPHVGPTTRPRPIRIAKAQRQALRVRDGGCQFPGCHVAPEYCIAHHPPPDPTLRPPVASPRAPWWELGGRTDLVNLVLLCRQHHRLIHKRAFTMARGPDGKIVSTRPRGDPLTPHLRARPPLLRPAPPPGPDRDEWDMTARETEYMTRCRITDLIRDAENRRRCRARPSDTTILRC